MTESFTFLDRVRAMVHRSFLVCMPCIPSSPAIQLSPSSSHQDLLAESAANIDFDDAHDNLDALSLHSDIGLPPSLRRQRTSTVKDGNSSGLSRWQLLKSLFQTKSKNSLSLETSDDEDDQNTTNNNDIQDTLSSASRQSSTSSSKSKSRRKKTRDLDSVSNDSGSTRGSNRRSKSSKNKQRSRKLRSQENLQNYQQDQMPGQVQGQGQEFFYPHPDDPNVFFDEASGNYVYFDADAVPYATNTNTVHNGYEYQQQYQDSTMYYQQEQVVYGQQEETLVQGQQDDKSSSSSENDEDEIPDIAEEGLISSKKRRARSRKFGDNGSGSISGSSGRPSQAHSEISAPEDFKRTKLDSFQFPATNATTPNNTRTPRSKSAYKKTRQLDNVDISSNNTNGTTGTATSSASTNFSFDFSEHYTQ